MGSGGGGRLGLDVGSNRGIIAANQTLFCQHQSFSYYKIILELTKDDCFS